MSLELPKIESAAQAAQPAPVAPVSSPSDELAAQRLLRMKAWALALLAAALALLVLAHWGQRAQPEQAAWGYLKAFAEAAMVGAMADWFAVVALFRHPLGLPIPHTAIISRRKDELGQRLGTFLQEHLLTPEQFGRQLARINPSVQLGRALSAVAAQPALQQAVCDGVSTYLREHRSTLVPVLQQAASQRLAQADAQGLATQVCEMALQQAWHQRVLSVVLRGGQAYLQQPDHHPQLIHWLINSFEVDNFMVKMALQSYAPKVFQSLASTLAHVEATPDHPMRQQIDQWLYDTYNELKNNPDWAASVHRIQQDLLAAPALQQALSALLTRSLDALTEQFERSDSVARQLVSSLLYNVLNRAAQQLQHDAAWQARLNPGLQAYLLDWVLAQRGALADMVQAQVASWHAEDMAQRLELAVGRDLQFIRINGTLVGGAVGLVLHALAQVASGLGL